MKGENTRNEHYQPHTEDGISNLENEYWAKLALAFVN